MYSVYFHFTWRGEPVEKCHLPLRYLKVEECQIIYMYV